MAGSLSDWFKSPSRVEQMRAAGIREDLIHAAAQTAFSRQSDGMLLALPPLLSDDEVVIDLIEGRNTKQTGILLLTTRRVVFVPKPSHRAPAIVITLVDVVTATALIRRGMSTLTLTRSTGDFVVDQILGNQAGSFADALRQTKAEPITSSPVRDPIDELIELRAMHRAGAISDAEFRQRKQHLVDRI